MTCKALHQPFARSNDMKNTKFAQISNEFQFKMKQKQDGKNRQQI